MKLIIRLFAYILSCLCDLCWI